MPGGTTYDLRDYKSATKVLLKCFRGRLINPAHRATTRLTRPPSTNGPLVPGRPHPPTGWPLPSVCSLVGRPAANRRRRPHHTLPLMASVGVRLSVGMKLILYLMSSNKVEIHVFHILNNRLGKSFHPVENTFKVLLSPYICIFTLSY